MHDDPDGRAFTAAFLHAFESLDLARFAACFADDATVFFPAPEPPARVSGRAAITRRFEQVFAAIRADCGRSAAPWHDLAPVDLQARALGPDAALVTFELRNPVRLARRTLVLRRQPDGWRILHLHASNDGTAA